MCEICDAEDRAHDRDLAPLRLTAVTPELAEAFRVIAEANDVNGITVEGNVIVAEWHGNLGYATGLGQRAFDLRVATFEAAQEMVDRAVAELKEITYEEAVAEREEDEAEARGARAEFGGDVPAGLPPELAALLAGLGGGPLD